MLKKNQKSPRDRTTTVVRPKANLAKAERHACRHAAPSNRSFSETKSTNVETARAICLRFGKVAYTLAVSCRYSASTLTRRPASISATHSG
jgi:hypothetical protein